MPGPSRFLFASLALACHVDGADIRTGAFAPAGPEDPAPPGLEPSVDPASEAGTPPGPGLGAAGAICTPVAWYADADCDGWGDDATATWSCEAVEGHVRAGGDCDDGDPSLSPATGCGLAPDGWSSEIVLVLPAEGADLDALAADRGTTVAREPGVSGWGALAVPAGTDAAGFAEALLDDDRVGDASLAALTSATSLSALQWHLDAIDAPEADGADLSGVVVAVLDTGVAYEDFVDDDGTTYARAATLADTPFTAPYDFVNDDAHPNDDHQHGTHIASIIASRGELPGVAPGATIMPVKVLDENEQGNELDLAEGIYWALDHGADVINLSLAMRPGVVPSPALLDALEAAWAAGVVVVAAAGNDGADLVSWPAAAPTVIAVGAGRLGEDGSVEPADYGNTGTALDVVAPGGDLSADVNGDGVPDGILAEAPNPGDPGTTAAWLMAGTSQAAAVASGAAARLVAAGADADAVRQALMTTAAPLSADPVYDGHGAGVLDLAAALDALDAGDLPDGSGGLTLTVRPAIERAGWGEAELRVDVQARMGDGSRPFFAWIVGELRGAVHQPFACWTHGYSGRCHVAVPFPADANPAVGVDAETGDAEADPDTGNAEADPDTGNAEADASASGVVTVVVNAAWVDGAWVAPTQGVYATDGLAALLAAAEDGGIAEPLAFEVTPDDAQGASDPYVVVLGLVAGRHAPPSAALLTADALAAATASSASASLDLDAAGLSSSPLGLLGLSRLVLQGAGLSSSPLGFSSMRLAVLDGAGLSSSPLGLTLDSLTDANAGSADLDGVDLGGALIDLAEGDPAEAAGTAVGDWIDAGGWVDETGRSATEALVDSGVAPEPAAEAEPVTGGRGTMAEACAAN